MLSFSALVPRLSAATCLRVSLLICLAGSLEAAPAQVTYTGAQITPFGGATRGVAADSNGNVYLASGGFVYKETPGSQSFTQSTIARNVNGLGFAAAVAVDSSGNVYIADSGNDQVLMETLSGGSYTPSVIVNSSSGLQYPSGVAVDGSGNIYVLDRDQRAVFQAVYSGGSYSLVQVPTSSLGSPTGVAADASGNVYIADSNHISRVLEETPLGGGSYTESTVVDSSDGFNGVGVDANGNVYVADSNSVVYKETLSGGSYMQSLVPFSGLTTPTGIAVDGSGNVFLDDQGNERVLELTVNSANFGSQAVGSTSGAIALNFSVASGTTVGSIGVLTTGTASLDFTDAGGSTCTATTYASGTTCAVNVKFTPAAPGLRMGAVVFYSGANNSGTVLATVPIYGVGTGPQAIFLPGPESAIASNFDDPEGLAMDGSGDFFVVDGVLNNVYEEKLSGGSYTQSTILSGLNEPEGIAVDGAGNLYVADFGSGHVYMETLSGGSYTQTTIGSGFVSPSGVGLDGAGNVYIADFGLPFGSTPIPGTLYKETLSGGSYVQSVVDSGLGYPQDVTVDGSGNLYVTALDLSTSSSSVSGSVYVETPSGTGYTESTVATGLVTPLGIAVDASGNLYVADDNDFSGTGGVVYKETPSGGSYVQSTLISDFASPEYVVLDGSGNLYATDVNPAFINSSYLHKVDYADAPSLSFPSVTNVGATDTTDGTLTIQVQNIGNQPLTLTALSYPVDFSSASSDTNPCTGSTSLSMGLLCDLPIQFTPQNIGTPLSENVTLTDNSLNVAGAMQSIGVSGTSAAAGAATQFTITTTTSVVAGAPFLITISALDSSNDAVTGYNGTVTFSSSDPAFVNPGPLTLTNGIGQVNVTLETAGTQTITAMDTVTAFLKGTGSFAVSAGAASHLGITGPVSTFPGALFNFTVIAFDAFSNVATGYSGTIGFSSSDPGATLPATTTLSGGTGNFEATLATVGVQMITATDTVNSGLTGTSGGITVVAPPNLVVTIAADDAGSSGNCTAQTTPGVGTDAACSLRDALAFSANAGAANISFDSTAFSALNTPAANTITLGSAGTLIIPANTTITGPTPTNLVTVDGATLYTVFEAVEEFYSGPVLTNLNIANGNGGPDPGGAGGFNLALSTLTLNNCVFTGNTGTDAGAIDSIVGLVNVNGTTFTGNQSFGGDGDGDGDAGAIYNAGILLGEVLPRNVRFSSLASHKSRQGTAWPAATKAKGIRSAARSLDLPTGTPGTVTVINSTFTNNSGFFTGGIFNGDGLLVSGSTFTGNVSTGDGFGDGDGGAIVNYSLGSLGEVRSLASPRTMKSQHSQGKGRMKQALAQAHAHGLATPGDANLPPPGIPSVINSTFTNNSGLYSGGVNNAGGFIWVAFSTFNQNISTGDGFGDADAAGFLSTFGGESIIANNTFFGNSSTSQNGAGGMAGVDESLFESYGATVSGNSGFFGGIYADSSAIGILFNSIVSSNTTTNTSTSSPSDPNDNGFYFDSTTGDVVGDPNVNLEPLGNYGGPTQTMIPLPGSSALCAGNLLTLADVEGDAGVTLTDDQRGLPNTNSTYPGYSSTPCVDAGAVQTNYSVSFTTNPPATVLGGTGFSAAVTLDESGNAFVTGVSIPLVLIQSPKKSIQLSGGSATTLNGIATYSLSVNEPEDGFTLEAVLPLILSKKPPTNLTALSSAFDVTAAPAVLTAPSVGTLLSSSVNFTWTAGFGVSEYYFVLGADGPGASDLYSSGPTTALSATVPSIPSYGVFVYATLYSKINGFWQTERYVFTETGTPVAAALTSPTPGTVLSGSSANFTWSPGGGPIAYYLEIGTAGSGSSNLYNSGSTTATSATVNGLPTLGTKLYVTLHSEIDGVWQATVYTFTEAGSESPAVIATPTAGSLLGTSATFTWAPPDGVTGYIFELGTTGPGSSDLYSSGAISTTSATVSGIPQYGVTVYATLYSRANGTWLATRSTYTELGTMLPASLISPTPGSTLGSSADFTWNPGAGPTAYYLTLGTTGVGSSNLYNSGSTTGTSASVTGIPENGVTVYATLYWKVDLVWQSAHYTYTETGTPVAAALTGPTPGTQLPGSSVTFTWTTGVGPTAYYLDLGTTGPGSSNLYNSGTTTVTSATVNGLPTTGAKVYATLHSLIDGVWQATNYTYTEQ